MKKLSLIFALLLMLLVASLTCAPVSAPSERQIAELQSQVATLNDELLANEREIGGLQAQIASLKEELSAKEAAIAALQQEIRDKQNQIEELEKASGEATSPPVPTPEPDAIKITAAEICAEWEAHELAANEKYKNKLVEVTGEIMNITEVSGRPYIAFSTSRFLCDVHAYLSPDQISVAMTLSKGDTVTVVGTCKGMGVITIDLEDCYIVQ